MTLSREGVQVAKATLLRDIRYTMMHNMGTLKQAFIKCVDTPSGREFARVVGQLDNRLHYNRLKRELRMYCIQTHNELVQETYGLTPAQTRATLRAFAKSELEQYNQMLMQWFIETHNKHVNQ